MLVLRVALVAGRVLDRRTLLLAGVVVGAFCNAAVLLFLTFADAESFRSAVFWMMGSLAGATWQHVLLLAVPLVIAGVVLFGLARSLNLLAVGEPTAAGARRTGGAGEVPLLRARRRCSPRRRWR